MFSELVCWCGHKCCEYYEEYGGYSFWDCAWECGCHESTEEDVDGFELLGLSLEDLYGDEWGVSDKGSTSVLHSDRRGSIPLLSTNS